MAKPAARPLVPDTSVLIDGRITELIEEGETGGDILVPRAAVAELEAQANRGLETGFAGLDELAKLQRLSREGKVRVEIVGERPDRATVEAAAEGAIDALIRDAAADHDAEFVTSDRVQAHAAEASGIVYRYLRPIVEEQPDLSGLRVSRFFEPDIMSVHLKADCKPMAKRGTPAGLTYEAIGTKDTGHKELRAIIKECIEFAKRDYNSFIELERHGCTVVQLGPMRITIAQPPFADGLEVTAVRPVKHTTMDDYDLPAEILQRLEGKSRGVLIAGPPGSGKSTFATAVVEHLHGLGRNVKTMEQPRDLQVPKEVTQYGALDKDMAWTGEVLLLVRPDHVVYDEVRTTNDFEVFADMRLAGIGLFGVTHANRPIDAVQRFIGRVDLGMIPQIVDTVVFIDAGQVRDILELRFTVKVPEGMMEADLARPVVLVRDVLRSEDLFELYTYGEQIVVMPIADAGGASDPAAGLAAREVERMLRRHVQGPVEVQVRGNRATVYVAADEVPSVIGRGGRTVQGLERKVGLRLDVKSLSDRPRGNPGRKAAPTPARGPPKAAPKGQMQVRRTGSNVFLLVGESWGGREVTIEAEGAVIGTGLVSKQGKLRFKAKSAEGQALDKANKAGLEITVRGA